MNCGGGRGMPEQPREGNCRGPIAMVTGRYPVASLTVIDREVKALRAAGCDIVTVTIRPPENDKLTGTFQKEEAARVHRVIGSARNPLTVGRAVVAAAARPRHLFSTLRLAIWARPSGDVAARFKHVAYLLEAVLLADFLRRRGVVHVHNHLGDSSGTVTMLAAELAGIPFSMTLHGPEVFAAPQIWRLDIKIARARKAICIAENGRRKALRLCSAAHHGKVLVIPCGVTPALYAAPSREPAGQKLMFVGRLVPRKEVPVLIEALMRVRASGRDAELDLVGDGPERERLEALAASTGLRGAVRFLGMLDEAGVACALRKADVLVVPSSSEGLPVVIMEAMASGLPVIASEIDGIPELVRDGETGLLVPPCNPERLAEAIIRLLDDADLARRMGEAGRRLVAQHHDADRNARVLLGTIFSDT
jgi:glycosyltransferase involved in cell wall biosynthesis